MLTPAQAVADCGLKCDAHVGVPGQHLAGVRCRVLLEPGLIASCRCFEAGGNRFHLGGALEGHYLSGAASGFQPREPQQSWPRLLRFGRRGPSFRRFQRRR